MAATQQALLPDHILGAVLALAEKEHARQAGSERLAFRSHDFHLQDIFSDLRKQYPILKAFVFSESGPQPYSPILKESVSRLQLSGLIGRENPDYEVVFVRPAANLFYDEVVKESLDSSEIKQLDQIAVAFLSRVTTV